MDDLHWFGCTHGRCWRLTKIADTETERVKLKTKRVWV